MTSRNGRISTFYSYKGGSGRSMAVANVGWILAGAGHRVLLIDWDLEAPGLHRYFHPFLDDPDLESSPGLIDFFHDFVTAARSPHRETGDDASWYQNSTDLLPFTLPVDWQFPGGGALEIVPAGRQDGAYSYKTTTFDWVSFYKDLGGGVFLEAVKQELRREYDFVLVDSRTGVNDTAGICTVQMPDDLVVFFMLNRQSIHGAAAVAESADRQRRKPPHDEPALRIWPVAGRVDLAEKERLEAGRDEARKTFDRYVRHLTKKKRIEYWGKMEIPYQPYFAYEEILATFADRQMQTNSVLAVMERLATNLAGDKITFTMSEPERREGLKRFYRETNETAEKMQWSIYIDAGSGSSLAALIARGLRAQGLSTWWWAEDVLAGQVTLDEIERALTSCDVLLAVFDRNDDVAHRTDRIVGARASGKPVIPVMTETVSPVSLPPALNDIKSAIVRTQHREADIERLVSDIVRLLKRQRPSVSSIDPDDPQKSRWGGKSFRSGRELVAQVTPAGEEWFRIALTVRSTNGLPLHGAVEFYLHPMFRDSVRSVPVENGAAELVVHAWGAFTVGAVADDGTTSLELDLAADGNFPKLFTLR